MLLGMYYGVINPAIGFMAGLKAFTAAVLGGIGSIPGAMLGGLLLGITEAMTAGYLSTEYKDVVAFGLLIAPFLVSRSIVDLATLSLIYVMLGLGLNVVVGFAGLLDLGYVV